MRWILLWTVLVLGAAGLFFLLGRDLWRKAKALFRELGTATERFGALTQRLEDLQAGQSRPDPAPGDVRSQGSSPRPQR